LHEFLVILIVFLKCNETLRVYLVRHTNELLKIEPIVSLIRYHLISLPGNRPLPLVLLSEFLNQKTFVGRLDSPVSNKVHLLVLLLDLINFLLLRVELSKGTLDIGDHRLLFVTFLLNLAESFGELAVQIIEPRLLDIDLFLVLQLFVFLEINGILVLLFVLLLPRKEVSDEFVETVVFVLLDPLPLDLLLVIHQLVVAVGLLDTLI